MLGIEFSRNQKLALFALIGLSAIGLSYGLVRDSVGGSRADVVLREPGDPRTPVTTAGSDPVPGYGTDGTGQVVFHVVGCVNKPGVYRLPQGERVLGAITAAGGAKPNADLQAINLAAKIQDGSRIHVPSREDTRAGTVKAVTAPAGKTAASRATAAPSGGKLRMPGEGTVNINTAGADELQRLPGVGPSTAGKILQYRTQIGRFTSLNQLMDVKGIGPKKLEAMRSFVTL